MAFFDNIDFSSTVGDIFSTVVGAGANAAANAIGSAIFGDDETEAERVGRQQAAAIASSGADKAAQNKALASIIGDDDLSDIKLGSTGFLTDQVDYRQVTAPPILVDETLQNMIRSLITSPPITPEVGLDVLKAMGPKRLPSLRQSRQQKRLSSFIRNQ